MIKYKISPTILVSSLLFLWISYSCFYLGLTKLEVNLAAGYLALIGQVGLDVTASFLTIWLYKRSNNPKLKIIYGLFFLSFISATLSDGVYHFVMNILNVQYFINFNSFFEIPFLLFLIFQLLAWAAIFFSKNQGDNKMSLFLPYLSLSILIFLMFIFGIPWKINYLSLLGIYQLLDTVFEVAGFTLATACLARTQNIEVYSTAIGYLIIISSDILIRHNVVSGTIPVLNPFETTWILGLLSMISGLFLGKTERFKLNSLNCLQSYITIWILNIFLFFIVLFLLISYILPQNTDTNLDEISKNLLSIIIPFTIFSIACSKLISNKITSPLEILENLIKSYTNGRSIKECKSSINYIQEFIILEKFVYESFQLHENKHYLEKEFAKIATQVAHDIRSPLVGLDLIIKEISNIPEEPRILIKSATNRIYDIANNLLDLYKCKKIGVANLSKENFCEPISELLLSVILEKKIQYKNLSIDFVTEIEDKSYKLFAKVSTSSFKRVISNLLNNAVEARKKEKCIIKIKLASQLKILSLTIEDNGIGIPDHLLRKIILGEVISHKKNGNGLGLSHAIKMIEDEWDGQFAIESKVNVGTKINIILNKAKAPRWFVSELTIEKEATVVILDDDETIHKIWKSRFKKLQDRINIIDFYNPEDFLKHSKQNKLKKPALYLIDYDFIENDMTGLDVIEELGNYENTYLVTNCHDELFIRERCTNLNIGIIPKKLASQIPIHITSKPSTADLIIVDDNQTLTDAWILYGSSRGKEVHAFNTILQVQASIEKYARGTPIYVDCDLNEPISGIELAKQLFEKGFNTIYLSTGYSPEHFKKMPWIRGIIGKEPPF